MIKTKTFIEMRTPSRIPIILKKSYSTDTASKYETKIEIGLYAVINLVAVDYFMHSGGYIVFDDKSYISFTDELSNIFLSGGRHQISIRHTLTAAELKELQSKKIDYFVLGKIRNDIDRFEKDFIRNIFIKIDAE